MYGKTGTACISLTQNAQKSDQVLDKVRARRIIVRSFVRSRSVNYTQNTKSVKQLNNRGCTNPLRKKASALRLCRIFFAAEPCSRSAFLFLRSLVSALRERTYNGKLSQIQTSHTTCTGQNAVFARFFYIGNSIKRNSKRRYDKKRRLKCRRRWSLKPKNAEAFFFYGRHSRFLCIARNRSVLISSLHGCLRKLCVRIILMKIE